MEEFGLPRDWRKHFKYEIFETQTQNQEYDEESVILIGCRQEDAWVQAEKAFVYTWKVSIRFPVKY